MIARGLPSFERSDDSPPLPDKASGIAIAMRTDSSMSGTTLRGSYRVLAADRSMLSEGAVRPQVWLVAIGRDSRLQWVGQPGGEALVLGEEEPASGDVEGWFHVALGECCRLPAKFIGTLDVTAVFGSFRSDPLEIVLAKA